MSSPPPPPSGKKAAAASSPPELISVEEQEEFLRVIKQLNLASAPAERPAAAAVARDHKFWKTQPVPQLADEVAADGEGGAATTAAARHGAIDAPKTVADVRAEPYAMPAGFVWSEIDFRQPEQAREVYDLLTHNYVEDDDAMFRFDYSVEFLTWALTPPGYHRDWHIGVRSQANNKLLAFISGIPVTTTVYEHSMAMAEVNFLCVHKKLRSKRLAPVLIKEVTRRVNLRDIWQAVYTAGVMLPMPLTSCRYFHRSLNPKKLIEVGFSPLPPRMTITGVIKSLALPTKPATPGFRPMEPKDVPAVTALLKTYLTKFHLTSEYKEEDVRHWMLPRDGVISSYVVENPTSHEVTDFCSYYHLPSTIIGNDKYRTLNAAYSFYNVATSVPLTALMQDLLVVAKKDKHDVFNALNLMENEEFLQPLKFGPGSGELQYYLYNWRCPRMSPSSIGIVLC